jgi:hypothetical protein
MLSRSLSDENRGSGINPGVLLIDRTLKRKMDESDMIFHGTQKRLKYAGSTGVPVHDDLSKKDAVLSDKDDRCEPKNNEPEEDKPEGNEPDEKAPPVIGSHAALSKKIDTTLLPCIDWMIFLPIWLLEHWMSWSLRIY